MTDSARRRSRARWAVPAAAVLVVGGAVAVPSLASADAGDLPETTPQDLLTSMAQAEPTALSGSAVYTARLGLPEVTSEMTGGADPLNLLGGSSTIRVWTDGQDRSRVSLLGTTSEYSVVTDGAEMWTYSSAKNEVSHVWLDDQSVALAQAQAERAESMAGVPTPEQLAEKLLAHAGEDAEVSLIDNTTVAGHDAYQLQLRPTTEGTLLERSVIAVDGETFLPLAVQVWSTHDPASPTLEVAFTDLSYETPDDGALAFSTPAGAEVTEREVSLLDLASEFGTGAAPRAGADGQPALPEGVTKHGEGWATIIEREGVDVDALVAGDGLEQELADSPWAGRPSAELVEEFRGSGSGFAIDGTALLDQLTTEVDGGRMLTSSLVSVLITDDGRVLAGMVPPQALLDTASRD